MVKHLISVNDLNIDEVEEIFTRAKRLITYQSNSLLGKIVVNAFFENSTRTMTSFEIAAKKLGGYVINLPNQSLSLKKGESILDTILTLNQVIPSFIVTRTANSGVPAIMDNDFCSIINAGDGCNEHPTQALTDAFTIKLLKNKIKGIKVAICGDILHSRVAHSNMILLNKLGAEVRVISPPNLMLAYLPEGVRKYDDIKECLCNVDVVMTLRLQYERMKKKCVSSKKEYCKIYGLNYDKLSCANNKVIVMHPGPVNRGIEISSEIADNYCSVILKQVKLSVPVRQATFEFLSSLH